MTRVFYFVCIGNDDLEDARQFTSKAAAVSYYRDVAENLGRFEQRIDATVHCAPSRDALEDYPYFMLSMGPRGGVRVEMA